MKDVQPRDVACRKEAATLWQVTRRRGAAGRVLSVVLLTCSMPFVYAEPLPGGGGLQYLPELQARQIELKNPDIENGLDGWEPKKVRSIQSVRQGPFRQNVHSNSEP